MSERAYIVKEKHAYNRWVASDTLEDFALRYTADKARRWSSFRVANAAVGAAAFLACEAIGASIAIAYGVESSIVAIGAAMTLMFFIGLPIAYYAAREGLDVDLLTRGAGFGYLGSTVTSLIYASFTFLLFAIEASIMSVALEVMFGIPISLAYVISAFAVIPIAIFGMTAIARFQLYTQPIWILLQLAPIAYLAWKGLPEVYAEVLRDLGADGAPFSLITFGVAFSTLLSLLPQIGEQADYMRFMPAQEKIGRRRWWIAVLAGGPGWALIGGVKLLLGVALAALVLSSGGDAQAAADPMTMFRTIFEEIFGGPYVALVLAGVFVIICQLKINVTNAYAGSIAWSNFFSRLTHVHPGRAVWLVFNVVVALLLMIVGVFDVIEGVLALYANLAAGWIGALAGDLAVSKPLGLSPRGIEFRRAYLYDINPVGVGAMALSIMASGLAALGVAGETAQAFAPVIGLTIAFIAAPAIAWATGGRYYIARDNAAGDGSRPCVICDNRFQPKDMADCPLYDGKICSLCCTLDVRCEDRCKEGSRAAQQVSRFFARFLPSAVQSAFNRTIVHFLAAILAVVAMNALICILIYQFAAAAAPAGAHGLVQDVLWSVFVIFTIIAGVCVGLALLARRGRSAAFRETAHHMQRLKEEIATHKLTDAKLQDAKRLAESASDAKDRLLISVGHEIRSPLNSIYGYAQLLEKKNGVSPDQAGKIIRRSAEHLINLVESLMDMSQVEGRVLKLETGPVQLKPFLLQIVNMFRVQAASKGVAFNYELESALPGHVIADSTRLRQILINLLSNAVKFTSEGGVTFRVRYQNEVARFEIADTGPGIEPDEVDTIFEPFERSRRHAKSAARGLGLGLSITKVLVHIMGGDIAVRSEPGKGSVFTVTVRLPPDLHNGCGVVAPAGREAAHDEPSAAAPGADPVPFGAGKRALAIDDDPEQLGALERFLTMHGFEAFVFDKPLEALAAAKSIAPDIALLDVNMPDCSGWEACETLREMFGDGIRIIMISADVHKHQSQGTERDARAERHDGYVAKPVAFNMLRKKITRLLGLEGEEAAGAPAPAAEGETGGADYARNPQVLKVLDDIEQFARIGHVSGVRAGIRALEDGFPQTRKLTQSLSEALAAFNLDAIVDVVRSSKEKC